MVNIEELSRKTLSITVEMILELWPDSLYETEYENTLRVLGSDVETFFLAKEAEQYVGFIYVNMRQDYVEGTETSPVAYIEGIYIRPPYRSRGLGKILVETGESWGKAKGATAYASDTELTNIDSISFHKRVGFQEVNRIVCFVKPLSFP
ncbi:MAG: aminoglycoside 6'-N-acetyltransferase [Bacteroidota bacterium]